VVDTEVQVVDTEVQVVDTEVVDTEVEAELAWLEVVVKQPHVDVGLGRSVARVESLAAVVVLVLAMVQCRTSVAGRESTSRRPPTSTLDVEVILMLYDPGEISRA